MCGEKLDRNVISGFPSRLQGQESDSVTLGNEKEYLKTEIKSTSAQHKNVKAQVTLIKKEAWDWEP